ncbi:MAG: response regulator [Acidobacteriota bacterium]|nr:response regulator [Acidobacteriota bacterium]
MLNEPTILLAEDEPEEQYKTRVLLEQCGCRVVEADSGLEAFELALTSNPDLVLLDLKTPVVDGFEIARRVRKITELRDVSIVGYTAHYSYSRTEEALEAGFDEYIIKPLTLEDVRALLRRYLIIG